MDKDLSEGQTQLCDASFIFHLHEKEKAGTK